MTKEPKVSVIIPVYNVERYISRSLESLMNQTLLDIEIICVNDGSPDGSVGVIRRYMMVDDRIRLIDKENGGVSSARNAGLRAATGDLIVFLDPDDYLDSHACERIYEEWLNKWPDILVFGSHPFPEIPEPSKWVQWALSTEYKYYEEFDPSELIEEPGFHPFVWNKAFSRRLLEDNHMEFDETAPYGEDIVFILEASPLAQVILFIPDRLHYYQHYRKNSWMYNAQDAEEKRLTYHISNMERITRYWQEHAFLEQWGTDYVRWFVTFIADDLVELQSARQQEMAGRVLTMMETYGLMEYLPKAPRFVRKKYRALRRLAGR